MAAMMGKSGSGGQKKEEKKEPEIPRDQIDKHPKRLIFAPGDIKAGGEGQPGPESTEPLSRQATPAANESALNHPARAHQFTVNDPLTVVDLNPDNPLHQFSEWFRDHRLTPKDNPESATLATANIETGRVSARVVYLKELDERGWVIYSNWGSIDGKGADVFGTTEEGHSGFVEESAGEERKAKGGNRWVALTFFWPSIERQVRIEGKMEALTREESEMYWRTRERGSQIGAWASQQSKVLWSARSSLASTDRKAALEEGVPTDDGRKGLEDRNKSFENRFSEPEVPLPPFWGGARLVPESVEFWQGRKSRLHDRFRYVRDHDAEAKEPDEQKEHGKYIWRIDRLSP